MATEPTGRRPKQDEPSQHPAARRFIDEETQFQLGFLVTESPHPETRNLSTENSGSTAAGVAQLLRVDNDIALHSREWFDSRQFAALVHSLADAQRRGAKIVFSGCGSTGRLAVLLEGMWRRFLRDSGPRSGGRSSTADIAAGERVRGIITGGDRALIRSVESFEDYEAFGAEQTRELGLREGDLFIAISEGGETSSVIGSAREALAIGCDVYFVYNNPTDLLVSRITRSATLINDPRVTVVDLTSGPMALSGSTRMQATTGELLFIGAAMNEAATLLAADAEDGALARDSVGEQDSVDGHSADWTDLFAGLVDALQSEENVATIAQIVDSEAAIYRAGGMVAYEADRYLLDIFADTTERTPTFSIPPMKRLHDDPAVASPWAIAFHRSAASGEAWTQMLGRQPIGLEWSPETYRRLGQEKIAASPPPLGRAEILSYPVGSEAPAVYGGSIQLLSRVYVDTESPRPQAAAQPGRETKDQTSIYELHIDNHTEGTDPPALLSGDAVWRLHLPYPQTAVDLFQHLAVKLIFNTVSTATMAKLGRVRGNWMVQVSPTNKKLIDRSIRIIADLTGIGYEAAADRFFRRMEDEGGPSPSMVQRIVDECGVK